MFEYFCTAYRQAILIFTLEPTVDECVFEAQSTVPGWSPALSYTVWLSQRTIYRNTFFCDVCSGLYTSQSSLHRALFTSKFLHRVIGRKTSIQSVPDNHYITLFLQNLPFFKVERQNDFGFGVEAHIEVEDTVVWSRHFCGIENISKYYSIQVLAYS